MYFALAVAIAMSFWGARGVDVPVTPTAVSGADARLQVVSSIGGYVNVADTAAMGTLGSTVFLSSYAAYQRRAEPELYCAEVVHEVGHVAGLPHRDDGVMNEVLERNAIWDCAHWKAFARRQGMRVRR